MKNKKILNYIFYIIIVINIIIDIIHFITSYNLAINGGCNYKMDGNIFFKTLINIIYFLPLFISFLHVYKNKKYKNKIISIIVLLALSFFTTPLTILGIIYLKENVNKNKFITILVFIISIITNPTILFNTLNILLYIFDTDLLKIFNIDPWKRCFNLYEPYF